MVIGKGSEKGFLTDDEAREIVAEAIGSVDFSGKRVLLIVPDLTRTAPIPLFFRLIHEQLGAAVKQLDVLVALGTHPPLNDDRMNKLMGVTPEDRAGRYRDVQFLNHRWDLPETLREIGTIEADEIADLSGGLMREPLVVKINRHVFDYDQIIVCGPTFPHEVAGFSGGNKYFFPGIAADDIINKTHWIGALVTNMGTIGHKYTPVRAAIDRAASMIPIDKHCFSLVVSHDGLHGVYFGSPEEAWEAASDLSAKIHIAHVDKPFRQVLSMAPEMYDDLWVGAKCMYKLEPAVADGGELIIYAPHITEVSYTHGKYLERVGYHTRDYFVKQMDKFRDVPLSILAHSTHAKGIGTFEDGVEKPRIKVTLATGIPEEMCRQINLGYRDPATINPCDWQGREDEGVLLVRNAGEVLYRLNSDA